MLAEPNFANEKDLEDAIAAASMEFLQTKQFQVVSVRGFGLDIGVFAKRGATIRTAFFEIKVFALQNGRCGFGNGKGEGNQIQLLFDSQNNAPRSIDEIEIFYPSIRWILGDRSKPLGSKRFVFFTSAQAQAAAAGGVRPGKQNNLRLSEFRGRWITWSTLLSEIDRFLED